MKRIAAMLFAALLFIVCCGCSLFKQAQQERTVSAVRDTQNYEGIEENDPSAIVVKDGVEAVIPESKANMLWCYNCLNSNQKRYYRYMLSMVINLTEGFIGLGKCESTYGTDIAIAYRALSNDFPEYYWMPNSYYISHRTGEVSVAFKKSDSEDHYGFSRNQLDSNKGAFDAAVELIMETVSYGLSDFEKEELIHEELCRRITYADDRESAVYTAYGALVNGSAVCEGYARAFQLLCNQCGIPCILATGTSKDVGHLWNMVLLGENWYHVDVTWDDVEGDCLYTYFNVTDRDILADHDLDPDYSVASAQLMKEGHSFNFSLPKTNASSMNYFTVYSLTISPYDTDKMCSEIARRFRLGEKRAQFRFFQSDDLTVFRDHYETIILELQQKLNQKLGEKRVKLSTIAFQENTCILSYEVL